MSRITSPTFQHAVFAQNTGEIVVTLITITHADLAEPIYVSSDPTEVLTAGSRGTVSQGHDFIFLPFELTPPGEDPDRIPTGKLKIDNVSREILLAIRSISSPADVLIQVVLASSPNVIEATILGFQIRNIRADALTVEGDLTTDQFDLEPFPVGRFTPGDFPGLF